MNHNSRYRLLHLGVENGLRDLQYNFQRGARNLLEVLEQFASGQEKYTFIKAAKKELRNNGSRYYPLLKRVGISVDHRILARFGANLFFNCWSRGAREIQEASGRSGRHIPWCVIHEMRNSLPCNFQTHISDGRQWGIRCHAVFTENHSDIGALLQTMKAAEDCAFFLFAKADEVNNSLAVLLSEAANVMVVVDMDYEAPETTCEILIKQKCLFGVSTPISMSRSKLAKMMAAVETLNTPFIFFVPDFQTDRLNRSAAQLFPYRSYLLKTVFPVFPIQDAVSIDRGISGAARIPILHDSGHVSIITDDYQIMRQDDTTLQSLHDILEYAIPKEANPS